MRDLYNYIQDNRILKMGLMIIISLVIMLLIVAAFKSFFKRLSRKNNGIHIKFFNSLIKVVIVLIEIYFILSLFDVTKSIGTTILGGSALLLTVASFASQQALGNVVSGFLISATKPYNINDKIKVVSGGSILAEGMVDDITTRHTIVKTFDGQSCIIPNSVMDTAVIINTTYTGNIGNFLTVQIGYDSDVDKAKELMKKIIIEHELTLNDDTMTVMLSEMTASGVILKTTVWTKELADNFKACSDIRQSIITTFAKNGIVIPYDTITIKQG